MSKHWISIEDEEEFGSPGNVLSIRPGERTLLREAPFQRGEIAPWHRIYRVALVPTPPLGDTNTVHRDQAVICAEEYPSKIDDDNIAWGWVSLEPSTKELIGRDLEKLEAEPNIWYWLALDTRPAHRLEESETA